MSHYSSKDTKVFVMGGYNLLGFSTSLGVSREAITEEDTVLGDEWITNDAVGICQATITQTGFFDDEEQGQNEAAAALLGTTKVGMVARSGNAALTPFMGFQGAVMNTWPWETPKGEFAKCNANWVCTGILEEGYLLEPLSVIAATGSTIVDTTDSATTTGGSGYLHIGYWVKDGTTAIDVKIQEGDAAGGPWTDLITFTQVTAEHNAQRVVDTSSDVGRYLKVVWTLTGTPGPTTAVEICVGFKRTPDPTP